MIEKGRELFYVSACEEFENALIRFTTETPSFSGGISVPSYKVFKGAIDAYINDNLITIDTLRETFEEMENKNNNLVEYVGKYLEENNGIKESN